MARQPQTTGEADRDDADDMVAVDQPDGGAVIGRPQPKKPVDHDDDDDEQPGAAQDDDDHPQDERIDIAAQERTPEEIEEQRAARRAKRARRREAQFRDREELAALRAQNEALVTRLSHVETVVGHQSIATLDAQRGRLVDYLRNAQEVYREAFKAGDADASLKASKAIAECERRIAGIDQIKRKQAEAARQEQTQQPQQQRQRPADPTVMRHAMAFARDYPEYEPGENETRETKAIKAIDRQVLLEGYDPKTPEYWDVLRQRVDAGVRGVGGDDDDADEPAPRRAAPRGPAVSGASQPRQLQRGQVYVSPEIKRAIQDAGYWDNPKERADALRYYKNGAATQRANGRA